MSQKSQALIQLNRPAMIQIWSKLDKTRKEGVDYLTYSLKDISALYYSGMMDPNYATLEIFQKFFEPFLQADGQYWLKQEDFIALGEYRYPGRAREPFDPLKMRQGRYTIERLWRLFKNSIIPSCALPPEFIKLIFDGMVREQKSPQEIFASQLKAKKEELKDLDQAALNARAELIEEEGKKYLNITGQDLAEIQKLLDTYPSPRRRREINVQEARQNKLQSLSKAQENLQKSNFEAGQDFRVKAKKDLGDVLVKADEGLRGGRKPTEEVLDLKSLQKLGRKTKF